MDRMKAVRVCGLIGCILLLETVLYTALAPARNTASFETSAALTPQQTLEYIKNTKDILIIDVRSHREYAGGHIPGSVNLSLRTLPREIDSIPTGHPILIYCGVGFRGVQAYKLIRRLRPELTDVHHAQGKLPFSLYTSP